MTLKSIHCLTGSQWSCLSSGVMCSHRPAPVTSQAAAFCTDCRHWTKPSEMPHRRALQKSSLQEMNAWTNVVTADSEWWGRLDDCHAPQHLRLVGVELKMEGRRPVPFFVDTGQHEHPLATRVKHPGLYEDRPKLRPTDLKHQCNL